MGDLCSAFRVGEKNCKSLWWRSCCYDASCCCRRGSRGHRFCFQEIWLVSHLWMAACVCVWLITKYLFITCFMLFLVLWSFITESNTWIPFGEGPGGGGRNKQTQSRWCWRWWRWWLLSFSHDIGCKFFFPPVSSYHCSFTNNFSIIFYFLTSSFWRAYACFPSRRIKDIRWHEFSIFLVAETERLKVSGEEYLVRIGHRAGRKLHIHKSLSLWKVNFGVFTKKHSHFVERQR